jgi:hypothetical protein
MITVSLLAGGVTTTGVSLIIGEVSVTVVRVVSIDDIGDVVSTVSSVSASAHWAPILVVASNARALTERKNLLFMMAS